MLPFNLAVLAEERFRVLAFEVDSPEILGP